MGLGYQLFSLKHCHKNENLLYYWKYLKLFNLILFFPAMKWRPLQGTGQLEKLRRADRDRNPVPPQALSSLFIKSMALPTQKHRKVFRAFWLLSLCLTTYAQASPSATASYQWCSSEAAKNLRHCDESLDIDERVSALLDILTLEEMIGMISPDPEKGNTCDTHSGSVDRIGLSDYMWLTEANTDIAADCAPNGRCRTSIYGPLGCGATFNETAMRLKGRILSFELRAFRNGGWYRAVGKTKQEQYRELVGLTAFGPNLNIPRDPRFGRFSELLSEDPFLTGVLGAAVVQGLQEPDRNGRPRSLAFMKHFAAYSVELNRGHDDHRISPFDLTDTYLRQFEIVVRQGQPAGAMCSYNAINGAPSCTNSYILNDIYREAWNQPDGIITTDCGAVYNLLGDPVNAPDKMTASAWAINNGSDLEMGSSILRDPDGLIKAVKQNLVSSTTVKRSARRLFKALMRVGLFDSFGESEYDRVSLDVVDSDIHRSLAHEIALQAPVLLRNDQNLLPLQKTGQRIAVVGPLGSNPSGLWSDYASKPYCNDETESCGLTLVDALQKEGFTILNASGVPVDSAPMHIKELELAQKIALESDIVVLALGTNQTIERETKDRLTTDLPGVQRSFALTILALGKPTLVVLQNGGPLSEDWLTSAFHSPLAVIEAFSPNARGMLAVAQLISGTENQWGKLPYTIYPSVYQSQVSMFDFDMSKPPGRTYRYFQGKALFPFGHGLSYTTFQVTNCSCSQTEVMCILHNTGARRGDEVVQVYHLPDGEQHQQDQTTARQTLVGFSRMRVEAGSFSRVKIPLDKYAFELSNSKGERRLRPGKHILSVRLGTLGGSADTSGSKCEVRISQQQVEHSLRSKSAPVFVKN